MNFPTHYQNDIAVTKLNGRVEGTVPALLGDELKALLTQSSHIVLDCGSLEYMDSTGLGCLVSCLRAAIKQQGDIRLAALSSRMRMLLELTRLDVVFDIFPTVDDAVASFALTPKRN